MGITERLNKILLISITCLTLIVSSTPAFAWGKSGHDRGNAWGRPDHRGHPFEEVYVGHQRYRYHDGRFFTLGLFGLEIAVFNPPIGAVVMNIPFGHKTIVSGGVTYYHYNNIYYVASPGGYKVVSAPVLVEPVPVAVAPVRPAHVVIPAQPLSAETVTVNIPNYDGSFIPVTLLKKGNGYVGPQGEYYPGHPTVEQLRALYGK